MAHNYSLILSLFSWPKLRTFSLWRRSRGPDPPTQYSSILPVSTLRLQLTFSGPHRCLVIPTKEPDHCGGEMPVGNVLGNSLVSPTPTSSLHRHLPAFPDCHSFLWVPPRRRIGIIDLTIESATTEQSRLAFGSLMYFHDLWEVSIMKLSESV